MNKKGFGMWEWYYLPVILIAIVVVTYGFAVPWLISAKSTAMVILGVVVSLIVPANIVVVVKKVYFKKGSN
ncbi:hypothetical protein Gekk315_00057 [Aeromonas phage Gekk3-15]